MTFACLTCPTKNPFVTSPEHGVSDDARLIYRTVKTVEDDYANTVTMSGRLQLASDALEDTIHECLTDDWDGYGARALQQGSLDDADRFLSLLPTTTRLPEVSVDPDGEVSLEWYLGPRRVFSVSVGTNGELVYAGLFGASKASGVESFQDEVPKTIVDNLARVYS